MRVLVVNAGSSSLKLTLLRGDDVREEHTELALGAAGIDIPALADTLRSWATPDVVGHRIVHGGTRFHTAVRIDADVETQLRELTDLAPLHQPKSLAALDAVTAQLPSVPAVACFDTAFHVTIPAEATTYAIPRAWRERYHVRRYGFHGLSHAYCSRQAAAVVGRAAQGLRVVTCHLGAGASLAAVRDGHSIDTTMGFTPLEGLVMATRSGSVDPGLLLWLEEHEHLSAHEVAVALEEQSGLLALAGTGDMRAVEAAAGAGESDARLALGVYTHRLVAGIAAMCAAMGGIDVLAFTGGVGERSDTVRRLAADRLGWLGVVVDDSSNAEVVTDSDISAARASVRTVVIHAREDLQIAAETRRLFPTDAPAEQWPY